MMGMEYLFGSKRSHVPVEKEGKTTHDGNKFNLGSSLVCVRPVFVITLWLNRVPNGN